MEDKTLERFPDRNARLSGVDSQDVVTELGSVGGPADDVGVDFKSCLFAEDLVEMGRVCSTEKRALDIHA